MALNTFAFISRTGGGKGTQAELLSKKTGFEIFSTGGKFRELRVRRDELGERVRREYDIGLLMPSWFATLLFQETIVYRPFHEGIIFEGACRKIFEAEMFHEVLTWLEREYKVIYLDISEETSIKRQLLRINIRCLDNNYHGNIVCKTVRNRSSQRGRETACFCNGETA